MAGPLSFLQSVLQGTYNGMSSAGEDLARGALDAATLPRDVYQGKVQTDPRYMSDEEFGRTLNFAGNVAGGGLTVGSAPEGSLGMFAGRRSKTFPWTEAVAADIGEQMGKHPTDIYKNTGIFRGVDDKIRYEIPDQAARVKDVGALEPGQRLRAADYLDHPELFKAYPELAEMPVMHQPGMQGASYNRYPNDELPAFIKMDMEKNAQGSGYFDPRSMMLHELQHGVQKIEGFAPGPGHGPGNEAIVNAKSVTSLQDPNAKAYTAYKDYARSAGEVEARQVQERADWPLERRMEMHPVQQQMTPQYPGDPALRFTPDQQWIPGKELPYPVSDYNPDLPFMAQFLGK